MGGNLQGEIVGGSETNSLLQCFLHLPPPHITELISDLKTSKEEEVMWENW